MWNSVMSFQIFIKIAMYSRVVKYEHVYNSNNENSFIMDFFVLLHFLIEQLCNIGISIEKMQTLRKSSISFTNT